MRTARRGNPRSVDVVLVAGSFWPREGGAERQLRQVLSAAARRGLRCTVVTQALPGQPRRCVVDGVAVRRVGSVRLLRRLPILGRAVCTIAFASNVLRLRPRAAVSIQLGSASFAIAAIRRAARVRHIVRLTGGGDAISRSEPWARRRTPFGRLIVWVVARRGVLIVSPARHLVDDLVEAFPGAEATTLVVPNGIPDPGPATFADDQRRGIVWYGRISPVAARDAFVAIAKACPDLAFTAIGRVEDLPACPNVDFRGWVEDPYEVMQASRVLLNTSPTEGMPNTALQAVAVGMHVVGPANAGLTELVERHPGRVHLVDLDQIDRTAAVLRDVHAAALPGRKAMPAISDVTETWIQLLSKGSP